MNYVTKAAMLALISELRDMAPKKPLSYGQSIQLARLQAARIRQWVQAEAPAINLIWLVKQRLVPVHFVPAHRLGDTTSGLTTDEVDGRLQVFINDNEPRVRQRFSLLHEFKHVIDFDDAETLHSRLGSGDAKVQAQMIETIANDFAAHVLMPSLMVKRAWYEVHDLAPVARRFNVSVEAMNTRLEKLNILGEPKPAPRTYFRRVGLLPHNAIQADDVCLLAA
jgi:predicted transcriptional regulator